VRGQPSFRVAALLTAALTVLPALASGSEPVAPLLRPLPDLSGHPHDLAEHDGRILVVNFWATWCVPCVEELPLLEEIERLEAARGVEVVAVSADGPGREAEVQRFVATRRLRLEVRTGATVADMEALGLGSALPATLVVDRDGAVAFRLLGPLRREDLVERIEWLLGERAVPAPEARLVSPGFEQAGEESHRHGAIGMEGASLVPS